MAGRSWVSVGMWRSPMTRTRTMVGRLWYGWVDDGVEFQLRAVGCVIACLNSANMGGDGTRWRMTRLGTFLRLKSQYAEHGSQEDAMHR